MDRAPRARLESRGAHRRKAGGDLSRQCVGDFLVDMRSHSIPVLIVGAGPAGIGCAVALKACGIEAQLVDAQGVGGSFSKWPRQMRLLTPSFHSNSFGAVDLNALTPQTSVADFLHTQHPTGEEYARYLKALVIHYQLLVDAPTQVTQIIPRSRAASRWRRIRAATKPSR